MNYAKLAFTDTIKNLQEKYGSRSNYERMEKFTSTDGLTTREIQLISQRDSFYSASVGENEFPYIQHRGGPRGFLKVLDPQTLGFLDFSGNMQYISVGNIQTNNKVSLFLMDYPNRRRLKIYAEAEIKSLEEDSELAQNLSLDAYKHKPERIILYHIKAFDWNCPQHITPRYTEEEINAAMEPQNAYVEKLELENKELKERLALYESVTS